MAQLMCEGLCSHELRILEKDREQRLSKRERYPPGNMLVDVDLHP